MIDIKFLRENPDVVRKTLRRNSRIESCLSLMRLLSLIRREERIRQKLMIYVQRRIRSQRRSELLWHRVRRKKQKQLRQR